MACRAYRRVETAREALYSWATRLKFERSEECLQGLVRAVDRLHGCDLAWRAFGAADRVQAIRCALRRERAERRRLEAKRRRDMARAMVRVGRGRIARTARG